MRLFHCFVLLSIVPLGWLAALWCHWSKITEYSPTLRVDQERGHKTKDAVATVHAPHEVLLLQNTAKFKASFEKFQNVCVDWKGSKPTEHLILLGQNAPERLWIHPTPNNVTNKQRHWVQVPTLLLTAPNTNPNHQFWDVLVNLFELDAEKPPFTHWNAPAWPCKYWMCDILPKLVDTLDLRLEALQHHITHQQVVCYHNVWVPKFSKHRHERNPIHKEALILRRLHQALVAQFSHPPADTVLIYGKADAKRRRWQNAKDVATRLNISGDVRYIETMAGLTFQTQCHLFWSARHIIYVHGGHTANLICARPRTRIDEMACPAKVGWSQSTHEFHRSLGFHYQYHSISGCEGHNTDFATNDAWLTRATGVSFDRH